MKPTLLVALLLCLAATAQARTWHVLEDGSGDAPTVQAGIDSAAAGDTVLVHPGTYLGIIIFKGKPIVVRSTSGPQSTILDGMGAGAVINFTAGESRSSVLQGFTLTHGILGITIFNSSPSVIQNVITANGPAPNGGGISCDGNTFSTYYPLIQENVVTNNRANNLAGGIGVLQWMVPEILDNYVADNEAVSGDGGGIYYRSFNSGAVIRGNTVINNRAGDHGGGIYVALVGAPPPALQVEISWNLVAYNVAHGSAITGVSGGGIHLIETNAWVHHNTIVGNEGGGAYNTLGGGIGIERIGSPVIEKNIIAYSTQGGVSTAWGVPPRLFRTTLLGRTPVGMAWATAPPGGNLTATSWPTRLSAIP